MSGETGVKSEGGAELASPHRHVARSIIMNCAPTEALTPPSSCRCPEAHLAMLQLGTAGTVRRSGACAPLHADAPVNGCFIASPSLSLVKH